MTDMSTPTQQPLQVSRSPVYLKSPRFEQHFGVKDGPDPGNPLIRSASKIIPNRLKRALIRSSDPLRVTDTSTLPQSPGSFSLPIVPLAAPVITIRESSPSRPRHIPIAISTILSEADRKSTLPASEPDSAVFLAQSKRAPILEDQSFENTSRYHLQSRTRHVDLVQPSFHSPAKKRLSPKSHSSSGKSNINQLVDVAPFVAGEMAQPSSRTNTLDSSTSVPSPVYLTSRKGSSAQLSITSSQSSMSKRDDYESASEKESESSAQATTAPSRLPAGGSPALAQSSSGSANLSGLVCNVHGTTGKEPHPLVGATTTILGDKLYVLGGRKISKSRPTLTSDLYELDLLRRNWSKIETKGDVPPPRYFHSVCILGDNKLVCYGGMSPEGGPQAQNDAPDAQVSVMSDIHIYDIPSHTWTRLNTTEAPQGRYAHCAAILPSGAVFSSSKAPLSAIHHNPAGSNPNQGSIGVDLDGRGGAEMIVVGGQDSNNQYIEQISVFNLRSLQWTSTKPMSGRSCGAYRSVVTPLTSMEASKVGAGHEASLENYDEDDEDDEPDPNTSGSAMLIYTNYNFLDVKLELQVRDRDGALIDKQMRGTVIPPGLRFPTGGVIGNNFVVAGTFLTSSKQEFSLWALDLRSLTWARIDSGSSIFSQGSWNRGVLWERRNAFIILGNRKRNLVDDYNNRRLNFKNMCVVQLEAFGLYDNPRKAWPTSDYVSASAPMAQPGSEGSAGGRKLFTNAEELGEMMLASRELCDMDLLAIDGTRVPVNSRIIGRRWGLYFNHLLREGAGSAENTETSTLRPMTSLTTASRNSTLTITPGLTSNGSTLTANNTAGSPLPVEPADVRNMPPNMRPRTLYLPHTVPVLLALVHFLYTGSLPRLPSHLANPQVFASLLQIARPYEIDGLAEEVTERLHEALDGRNAAAIFNAAAMAAGGGKGVTFSDGVHSVHPPRVQSLAGLENMSLNGSDRGRRSTLRRESVTEEDEDMPDSASTTNSSFSITSSRYGGRENDDVWDGGQSYVIGLQKRGLRGLMEGRRIRERGRSEGTITGFSGSATGSVTGGSVTGASVASGSQGSGTADPKGFGLGIQ